MPPGAALIVLATDPEAPIDVAAVAADAGCAFAVEREPRRLAADAAAPSTAAALSRSSTDVRAVQRGGAPSRATPTVRIPAARPAATPGAGVLDHRAARRRDAEPLGRGEEHVRRRLAVRDLVAGDA